MPPPIGTESLMSAHADATIGPQERRPRVDISRRPREQASEHPTGKFGGWPEVDADAGGDIVAVYEDLVAADGDKSVPIRHPCRVVGTPRGRSGLGYCGQDPGERGHDLEEVSR